MTGRFTGKHGAELCIKDTSADSCCLRVTDKTDQAYFVIKPDQADEIIKAIIEQFKDVNGEENTKQG